MSAPSLGNLWNREPVLVIAVAQSCLALLAAFGFELTAEQVAGITACVSAVLSLVVRRKVSPTE